MFNETPEYSSDVEWLLQNRQAEVNTILKALVSEHFEPTLQLAFLLSQDLRLAHALACETFSNAILARHRYSSDQEVQEWLDQILISICKEVLSSRTAPETDIKDTYHSGNETGWKLKDNPGLQLWRSLSNLPFSEQAPILLSLVRSYPVSRIAQLCKLKESVAASRIKATQDQLLSNLNGIGASLSGEDAVYSMLSQSIQERWQTERASIQGSEEVVSAIQDQVERKRRERRRKVIFQEVILLAVVIVLVITLVQAAVFFSEDPNAAEILPALRSYFSAIGLPDWN